MIKKQQYTTLVIAMNKLAEIGTASEIVQMHRNTGSKYLKSGKFPGESGKRKPGFIRPSSIQDGDWEETKKRLEDSTELEATAVLENLMERFEGRYTGKEIRSLQRKICDWRALHGREQEVMFSQTYSPGEPSQSDFVDMDYLNITIQGKQFNHLIFHFVLPYSGWEDVMVCEGGESFENLCAGYERSIWRLRGVPKIHRTDNLSAAITASTRNFTDSWGKLMSHYNTQPTVNNPGKSNENGVVERSNGLIKRSLANQLCFRGSKDFKSIADYGAFVDRIVDKRNKQREIKVSEERQELHPLPEGKWYAASHIPVRVNPDIPFAFQVPGSSAFGLQSQSRTLVYAPSTSPLAFLPVFLKCFGYSTIRVGGASYSVPSRTIGHILSAYIYPNKIEVYYGNHLLQIMPKFQKGEAHINFMHVISSLRKKPGAFEDYKYKEYMYPTTAFRQTYDTLKKRYKTASKYYIEVLYLASVYGVEEVSAVLAQLLKAGILPQAEDVKKRLAHHTTVPDVYIRETSLKEYDNLTGYTRANQ